MTETYAVKALVPGRKRWEFVRPSGGTTNLRIHAIEFRSRERAEAFAQEIAQLNAGVKARVDVFRG